MRKSIKKTMALVIATTTILGTSIPANAEWKSNSTGWWNTEGSSWSVGWEQIDGAWYYFDNNGYMKIGWILENEKWYYLNIDGTMVSNATVNGYIIGGDGVWTNNSITPPPVTPIANTIAKPVTITNADTTKVIVSEEDNSSSSSSSSSTTNPDVVIISNVGAINPSKNSFIGVDKETKMTIYYYKSNGKVAQIQNPGICDGTNIYDPNNEVYNYIVVDSNMNIAFNPEHLYVENGKLVKKSSSSSITVTPVVEPTETVIEPIVTPVTSPSAVAMV